MANKATTLNPTQVNWITRQRAELTSLHSQWYGNRDFDQYQFSEVDRKVREAADRLRVEVADVRELEEQNEGWDGELYGPFEVLSKAIRDIEKQFEERGY